jgi:putative transcriptional regulator
MAKKRKKPGRLAKALLETAGDMRKAGLLNEATYGKIAMRHLGAKARPKSHP